MLYEARSVVLKDGRTCLLRSAQPDDAKGMLDLLFKTACETDFLTRGPEDPLMSEAEERAFLKTMQDSPRQVMLVAVVDGLICGSASVFAVSSRAKLRHRAVFGISLLRSCWHLGLGSLMSRECIRLAREMGYEQLELQVFSGNERARALYERLGFELWGMIRNGFKLPDGSYQDDVMMGMFLK